LHHYELLPSEPVVADSFADVAFVGELHVTAMGLHSSWNWPGKYHGIRCYVAAGAEGLLLSNGWQGLRDHSFASDYADSSANSFPNTATHASTDAATHSAAAAATHSAAATATHSAAAAASGGPSRTR